jgi:hypothetical protein
MALSLLQQQSDEALRHGLLHQHALDRRTALPGVQVRAHGGERRRLLQVGILHDNDRIVAAQLQYLALVDGLGGDVLADRHAAGEGDQIHIRVRQHLVGDLARGRRSAR